jgi:ribonuclease T
VYPDHTYFFRVEPFEGANIEAAALEFTGIKLDHPLRMAVSEETALTDIFRGVRKASRPMAANGRSWSGTTAASTWASSTPRSRAWT